MVWAELLARSSFSFLRGGSQPEEMVERAHALGLSAIALCDRSGLYGQARGYARARALGQRLLVGAELVMAPPPPAAPDQEDGPTLALIVRDAEGYESLCRLLTAAHAARPKGEAALTLAELGAGVAGLWGVLEDGVCLDDGLVGSLVDILGDRLVLAVSRHGERADAERELRQRARARRFGAPIVAVGRAQYHEPSRKELADVLTCVRLGTTLERAGLRLSANCEAHLRSEAQILRAFRDEPGWVHGAGEVAADCRFQLGELRYAFPCRLPAGVTADEELARLTWVGASWRYPRGVPASVRQQLEKELGLIARLGMAPYFLSTKEIVEIARERRILCQGRGSAANSAVCFVLGITAVDPARSSLLFERFMSEERHEPPDIDIDFEHERREEVIQEIYRRYGRDRAAMVCEVISYRGKSALRDVGKAFGLSLAQVDRLASVPSQWSDAEVSDKELAEVGLDAGDARLRSVLAMAQAIQGFPRHLSIHVGGFVLSAEPLARVAPVEPARMPGRTVIPWDKDDLDVLGFFKVDVLALGMLTAVRKCLALLHAEGLLGGAAPGHRDASGAVAVEREASGVALPVLSDAGADAFDPIEALALVPPEDPAVYGMVSRGDTLGVFQIESRAQMAMLPRLQPRCFYDLVIEVAIVRPGPIQGGMVHPYLRRRSGVEPARSPHPCLDGILGRTLGVPLFQEQVMQIAIVGAGYTGGEADQLRRDMAAWKRHGRLLQHRERLLEGFARRGIATRFGEALFEQIKGFGEYGFPESHAASFALIVYSSSWQKAHYPTHFACALLNAQPMGFYSPSAIIQDAQRHGVEVRDVCVLHSRWDSTVEVAPRQAPGPDGVAQPDRALRLGFRMIKGLRRQAIDALLRARAARTFADVDDLIRRGGLRAAEVERLAEAGALSSLEASRRQALWRARSPRAPGLFEQITFPEQRAPLPELSGAEQLVLDYRSKELSVADHPLRHLRQQLASRGVQPAGALEGLAHGTRCAVAGLVTCRQRPATASGVVFITLEDETGNANLVLWSRVYDEHRAVARDAGVLLAFGRVERAGPPGARGARGGDDRPASVAQGGRGPALSDSGERGTRPAEPGGAARAGELAGARGAPPSGVVVHLIVERLERLDRADGALRVRSRDFH